MFLMLVGSSVHMLFPLVSLTLCLPALLIFLVGVAQQVLDAFSGAIKWSNYMETNGLYSLSPDEDVIVIVVLYELFVL